MASGVVTLPGRVPVNPVARSQDAGYSRNHNRGIYTDLTIRQELPAVLKGLAVQGRIAYDHFSNIYENYSKTYVYGSPTVVDWLDGKPQLGKEVLFSQRQKVSLNLHDGFVVYLVQFGIAKVKTTFCLCENSTSLPN